MTDNKGTIQSVDKAFILLETLLVYKRPVSLKELAADTGFPKSTTHAILATMRSRDIVGQDERGEYVLGSKLFEYGLSVYSSWDDVQLANPVLGEVASKTKSNSILAVSGYDSLVNVGYWATNEAMVGVVPFVGTRNPYHATAQGKVFLASFDDKKLNRFLKKNQLKKYTPYTITDPDVLKKEIDLVREKGFAICNGEFHKENRVISVPVYNKEGEVLYALGVLDDIKKIKDDNVRDIVSILKKESRELSKIYSKRR